MPVCVPALSFSRSGRFCRLLLALSSGDAPRVGSLATREATASCLCSGPWRLEMLRTFAFGHCFLSQCTVRVSFGGWKDLHCRLPLVYSCGCLLCLWACTRVSAFRVCSTAHVPVRAVRGSELAASPCPQQLRCSRRAVPRLVAPAFLRHVVSARRRGFRHSCGRPVQLPGRGVAAAHAFDLPCVLGHRPLESHPPRPLPALRGLGHDGGDGRGTGDSRHAWWRRDVGRGAGPSEGRGAGPSGIAPHHRPGGTIGKGAGGGGAMIKLYHCSE